MWSMQADGRTEDIWINFETSSRYREYGGYTPEFNYQRGVSSESMMEDIKLLNHIMQGQRCRMRLSYLQTLAL